MNTQEERVVFATKTINDLEGFIKVYFKDLASEDIPDFHKEIYKLLTSEKRIAIAAPRGFAKSMICSVFYPIWLATYAHAKDICIISASEGLAIELLRKIRTTMESNLDYISIFGDVRSSKWTENHIVLSNGVNIRAKGAGGQIRGFRPDCLILDDIETDESVVSEDQRKKLRDWLFKACLNTLLPKGQFVMVGTILHVLSVLNDILDTPNGWAKKRYTAYVDGIEDEGHELWAKARPHKWLQERKAEIGSFNFASEFMNDPRSDESAPIKPEQIRYWEEIPKQYSAVIAVDPAYSEDDKSDWKVASLVLIDQNQNRYLSTYIRTHAPIGEFIDSILNLYQQHKNVITSVGLPNSSTEKMFFTSVLKRAEERKIYPPFIELKNSFISASGKNITNKKARIVASLQPLFENGKYYIHESQYEVKDELLSIGSSRHDDIIDTLCYAEQILQPNYEAPKQYEYDDRGYLIENEPFRENYGL